MTDVCVRGEIWSSPRTCVVSNQAFEPNRCALARAPLPRTVALFAQARTPCGRCATRRDQRAKSRAVYTTPSAAGTRLRPACNCCPPRPIGPCGAPYDTDSSECRGETVQNTSFLTEFKFQTIRGLRGSDCDPARPLRPSSRFTHRPLLRSRPPAAHPRRRRRPQPPPSPPPAQQLSARTGRSSCRICRMCQSAPVDSTVVGTGVAERRRRGRERTPSPQAASRSSPPPQPPPARRTTGRPYRSAGEEWGGGVAGESRGGRAAHRDEVSDVRGRHDSVSALQPPPALEVCGRAQAEREAQQAAGQPRRVA